MATERLTNEVVAVFFANRSVFFANRLVLLLPMIPRCPSTWHSPARLSFPNSSFPKHSQTNFEHIALEFSALMVA